MRQLRDAKGFTLIEVLIVLSVIGILAAMATVRTGSTKSRAYRAAMKEDLRTLVAAEEAFYSENTLYTTNVGSLPIELSSGVTATINATASGWTAQTTHPLAEGWTCAVAMGNITPLAPATRPGAVTCQGAFTAPGCGG